VVAQDVRSHLHELISLGPVGLPEARPRRILSTNRRPLTGHLLAGHTHQYLSSPHGVVAGTPATPPPKSTLSPGLKVVPLI
jgi:hypothetical protein